MLERIRHRLEGARVDRDHQTHLNAEALHTLVVRAARSFASLPLDDVPEHARPLDLRGGLQKLLFVEGPVDAAANLEGTHLVHAVVLTSDGTLARTVLARDGAEWGYFGQQPVSANLRHGTLHPVQAPDRAARARAVLDEALQAARARPTATVRSG